MLRTLGMGMDSSDSPPRSSSKFLMRMERSATGRSTCMLTPSDVVMLMSLTPSALVEAIAVGWGSV